MEVLEDRGLDGLSTRAVADRLGVRMNTVLWHVKTKTRLLELMADAVTGEAPLDALPDAPRERVRELVGRFRAALLDTGRPEKEAAWTAWTLLYFTLGLTQEEQAAPGESRLAAALPADAHPALRRVLPHLDTGSFADRFAFGVEAILG
ncbi:TetR family transcriptional regulator [Actinocorallia aurea]